MGAELDAGATLPEPERVSEWAAYGAIGGQALCTAERLGCTGAAIRAREGGVGCRLRRKRSSTARTAPRRDHRAYRRCAGDTQRRRHGEHRPSQHAEEVNWRAGEAAKRAAALAERPAPENTARTRDAHGMSPVTRNAVSGHTARRRRGDVARFRDPHPVNEQPRFALGDPRPSSTSTPLRSRRHARHPRQPPGCVRGFRCGRRPRCPCAVPVLPARTQRASWYQPSVASRPARHRIVVTSSSTIVRWPARRHVPPGEGRRAAIAPPPSRAGEEGRRWCAASDGAEPGVDLASIHPDVLTYPAIAVDETVGIVSADGTAMSRAQAHEHPRHPPHEAPPNHRGVNARKPRSADLLQLYVFGRKRGRLSWNETSSQQTTARPLRARLRRAGPHG